MIAVEIGGTEVRSTQTLPSEQTPRRRHSLARLVRGNRLAVLGVLFLLLITAAALLAPVIAPYSPTAIEMFREVDDVVKTPPFPPSTQNIFGTDQLGRDLFSRVLFAVRTSLFIGIIVRGGAMLVGATLGIAAGYSRGLVGSVIMRLTDLMMAFPPLLIAMAITGVLGPSLASVVIALVIVGWPDVTRLVYGQTLAARESDYVLAARAVGARGHTIMSRHILVNVAGPIIVAFSMGIPGAIMYEAGLSFFGFGIQPPAPSLGSIISDGRGYMSSAPWYPLLPGLVLVAIVLAFNFIGDGLIDLFDPREGDSGRYK